MSEQCSLGDFKYKPKKFYRWTFQLKERLEDGSVNVGEAIWINLALRPWNGENDLLRPKIELPFVKDEERRKQLQKQVVKFSFTYDDNKTISNLYQFAQEIYNIPNTNPTEEELFERVKKWGGELNLYDGCGALLETWNLWSMFPISVNFSDLDFTSSESGTIELTLVYNESQYKSNVPGKKSVLCHLSGMLHWVPE
jgi:hypothetical protein